MVLAPVSLAVAAEPLHLLGRVRRDRFGVILIGLAARF
jgi:hypothetical protein